MANRESERSRQRAYYLANRERLIDKARDNKLKSKFGITAERFDELLKAQDFKCAICGSAEPAGQGTFHVDHCHKQGHVRGLLCARCNIGLGYFLDSPSALIRAAEYLGANS